MVKYIQSSCAHCKCMGDFYSLITFLSLREVPVVLKQISRLPNGANFILIDHCWELLSINEAKVSSEKVNMLL